MSHTLGSRSAAVVVAVLAAVAVFIAGCGGNSSPAVSPAPARVCAVIADATGSDTFLTPKTTAAVTDFVHATTCTQIDVAVISANSVGEDCTRPPVSLASMTTSRDNRQAWQAELDATIVPQIVGRLRAMRECVVAAGRAIGTDVSGAFTVLAQHANSAPADVLVISDLVQNVGVDVQDAALEQTTTRTQVIGAVAAQLPVMTGWQITLAGVASGTTAMGPAKSAALHTVWVTALSQRGATVHDAAV